MILLFFDQNRQDFVKITEPPIICFVLKTIVDKYVLNCSKGGKLYACFIDLRKAVDTVWHEGLLLKLQNAGINGNIYALIKSMYRDSVYRVKCKKKKKHLSSPITITQGVHQGSVLSPILFNIFMNDISDELQLDDAPVLNDYKLNHLLDADDLLLLSISCVGLQNNIDRVFNFCKNGASESILTNKKLCCFQKVVKRLRTNSKLL